MAEERITIYDGSHNPIGEASRERAHREGLWHEVVHCWMACRMGGRDWIYFQQRAFSKADFPGFFDIASTGHVDAGESPEDAAVREAFEETGVRIDRGGLAYLGMTQEEILEEKLQDREFAHVYLYWLDVPAFAPGEEVEKMVALPAEELEKLDGGENGRLYATDLAGNPLVICRDQFCSHPGEFKHLVVPGMMGKTNNKR